MCAEKNKCHESDLINAGIAGSAYETVQRFGSATKEHYVAYSGQDNESGQGLAKGLKQISEQKLNPKYRYNNIHQQAGYSAEIKDTARSNAEKIIKGEKSRKTRTDDLGRVNDPLYDTVEVDANGNIIKGSEAQMKFVGASEKDPTGKGNAARALDKFQSKKYQKYLDADVKIVVPSDQYENIITETNRRIERLSKQLENQRKAGNDEQVKILQERINRLEKIKKNLRKSSVSTKEAVFARQHPELSTTIDVVKLSHRAGIETLKSSAIIGGSVSIVKNAVEIVEGNEDIDEGIVNIAKDTASTSMVGYGTGFAGAALKGAMQNSSSEYIRILSKTNLAGTVVAFTVSAYETLSKYFNGEIDEEICLETLGEQGTGMISSAMFAAIGQTVISIPIIGGLIGGMVGYSLSSASYGLLLGSLKKANRAREERVYIEKVCREHIKLIREYQSTIENIINAYLADKKIVFNEAFCGIKNALSVGDVDWFIDSTRLITESFGGKMPFTCMSDFDKKMLARETFVL